MAWTTVLTTALEEDIVKNFRFEKYFESRGFFFFFNPVKC